MRSIAGGCPASERESPFDLFTTHTRSRPNTRHASARIRPNRSRRVKILLADLERRINPHTSVVIPYRLSARPITSGCRRYINRWRRIVAWGGGCGSDNRSYGKATYESRADISAACTGWGSRGIAGASKNVFIFDPRGQAAEGHVEESPDPSRTESRWGFLCAQAGRPIRPNANVPGNWCLSGYGNWCVSG
jgi:hypothetical protein